MPQNTDRIAYKATLNPWAIACVLPEGQKTMVGRFRSKSDADGHLQHLRQNKPNASFVLIFDPHGKTESVTQPITASPKTIEEAVIRN